MKYIAAIKVINEKTQKKLGKHIGKQKQNHRFTLIALMVK